MRPAQAHQSLLAVVFAIILAGEHRAIKHFHAAGQVNAMLAQVLAALRRIMAHA
jgi:hypothetical protein